MAAEEIYRTYLANGPDCLAPTLDTVVSPEALKDDAVTSLARQLCFAPGRRGEAVAPALSEALPHMLDHGLRQVALANTVLADEAVRSKLPKQFDAKLFGQALLVADAGLTFVPAKEVAKVNACGPKYAEKYGLHTQYGYEMAQTVADPTDEASKKLGLLIARHHAIQARNAYGPAWPELSSEGIDAAEIDLMIALQKPFDYFDDTFSRPTGANNFAEHAMVPLQKFTATFDELLRANLELVAHMEQVGFDAQLPTLIAGKILDAVLDEDPHAIGAAYRQLRPDLTLSQAEALLV
ncbi:MAG TPA: hypothetical protein VJR27_03565 [Candidatus Saccharimonadales bacterium]|nr:hypothetical protein [Candidatus Saccharimonadales bacterium]